jgi:hypothetical protein
MSIQENSFQSDFADAPLSSYKPHQHRPMGLQQQGSTQQEAVQGSDKLYQVISQ